MHWGSGGQDTSSLSQTHIYEESLGLPWPLVTWRQVGLMKLQQAQLLLPFLSCFIKELSLRV